jgi:guanosine-3',5'-bis(diphosphate) 3'-pyrophosphohydrolase
MKNKVNEGYLFLNKTPGQFLERRLATLFGINSMALRALDLVCEEMCIEKGFKRDDGQDYYNHCIDVANTLISFCLKDEDAICAALLHDIIEDIPGYTYNSISKTFNPHVADLVMLVTKKEGIDYKEEKNIKNYLEAISQNVYASAIKTSDRMHNMMTLQEKTFEARHRKALETEQYYLPFFKYCRKKYPRYENLFYAARTQIHPLIFEIKSFYGEIQRLQNEIDSLKRK